MTGLVLDASAAIELTRDDSNTPFPEGALFAPAVIDVEYLHTLRRLVRLGQLAQDIAHLRVAEWADNQLIRCQHLLLLSRIWELRGNFSAYDASYVALAERLGTPLVTADLGLAHAASAYCEIVTLDG